jgi:hypothetical protein
MQFTCKLCERWGGSIVTEISQTLPAEVPDDRQQLYGFTHEGPKRQLPVTGILLT